MEHVPIAWIYLLIAIAGEVFATSSLRAGVDEPLWNIGSVIGYAIGFVFLGLALRKGMAVGAAYAIWGALGVVATSFIGFFIFSEQLSLVSWLGIAAIVIGVVLVEGPTRSKSTKTEVTS